MRMQCMHHADMCTMQKSQGLFRMDPNADRFTEEDFAKATDNGRLCPDGVALDRAGFQTMMLRLLRDFVQVRVQEGDVQLQGLACWICRALQKMLRL